MTELSNNLRKIARLVKKCIEEADILELELKELYGNMSRCYSDLEDIYQALRENNTREIIRIIVSRMFKPFQHVPIIENIATTDNYPARIYVEELLGEKIPILVEYSRDGKIRKIVPLFSYDDIVRIVSPEHIGSVIERLKMLGVKC